MWPAAALVAVAAYVAMCLGAHAIARERFAAALPPVEIQRVAALPVPGGGPLRWRGIAETPTGYVVGDVRLLSSTRTPPRFIAKGLDHHLVSRLNEYRLVRVFLDFARFPVVEWQSQGTRQVVRYYDLRFVVPGRQRSWFDLEVHLDGHGQVQAIAFLRRVFRPGHPDF
ncbi:MAG: hypothetical protein KatS3mg131_3052 [Candidatus Tectimicrobiota bacterium]|nr:MAG: hypothetical protein KatS3mg131_3052 [Candidatus Tectomicrobia bacterium]